jgi:broad-specificity NMP kinase
LVKTVIAASEIAGRSFVAEIIGPAGAGKTSLSRLMQSGNDVRSGLSVWRLPARLLIVSAVRSVPTLISWCRRRERISWEDLKLVIQHNALLRLIHRESAKGHQTFLLDEGNLFAIAKLRAFGFQDGLKENDPLMQSLFNKLAPTLNAVVWLDAPDAILARRIREREKSHRMKEKSDSEIADHLSRYRNSFERVVAEVSKRNGDEFKVFRFSTDLVPLEEIASTVLAHARARV